MNTTGKPKLSFTYGRFHTGYATLEITEHQGAHTATFSRGPWPNETHTFEVLTQDFLDLEQLLDKLEVQNWRDRYEDPSVLDGVQWRLAHDAYQGSGSNAAPEELGTLLHFLTERLGCSFLPYRYEHPNLAH